MASRIDFVNFNYNHSSGISNISKTEDDEDMRWSFEFSVILATILSISAFFTIVGNIMVLMVIIRHRGMRTRTNLFLVNLAVADLLVGLFVVPFTITTLVENRWIFGSLMCVLNGWMNSFCLITSFHTLMYISVHKYFSIVRPLSNPLKLTYILSMMAAAWLWAAIISTLNITVLVVVHKPGTSQCGPRYPDSVRMFIVHGVIQLTVIVLPATILVFCYVRMFMEIRKHSQRLRKNSTVEEDFILCQQKKVAITLFIVLATFVMMALPYHAYATYTTIKKDKKHFSSYINPLAYMFLYLSSMCNPIIYAFRSPAFRQGYKEILCHTPNYVISDDSELGTRTRRLSSLISTLRRPSTAGCRNSMHYVDNRALTFEALEPEKKQKSGKQKSLFKLLRSTRQSTAQSVVHRNGDIIIMKGGKIVSVRRAGEGREGSPLLDRLKTLKETTQSGTGLVSGLAGPGHVMFGLLCDRRGEDEDDLVTKRHSDNFSEGSDDVFSQVCNHKSHEHSRSVDADENVSEFRETVTDKSKPTIVLHGDNMNHATMEVENGAANEKTTFLNSRVNFSSNNVEKPANFNHVTKEIPTADVCDNNKSGESNKCILPYFLKSLGVSTSVANNTAQKGGGGVVVHVDDDNDVLSVMPLTPHTRECLAKSDLYFAQTDPKVTEHHDEAPVFRALPGSHSSENLFKKPPAVQRLMSVEFLDPPVHMFRSKSNVSMHSNGGTKSQTNKQLTGSPELKSSLKPLRLRSPFSSKKIITQV